MSRTRGEFRPAAGQLVITKEKSFGGASHFFEVTLTVPRNSEIVDHIKLTAAVGKDKRGSFVEINVYYGAEEYEMLSINETRKIAQAHLDIAHVADMLLESLPNLPPSLEKYFQ
jgi:hypothetical protein